MNNETLNIDNLDSFNKIKEATLNELLEIFFNIDLQKTVMLRELIDLLTIQLLPYNINYNIESYVWLLLQFNFKNKETKILNFLLIIKEAYNIQYLCNTNRWLLPELGKRNLFKKVIMTLPYGGTTFDRRTYYYYYLLEFFNENNTSTIQFKQVIFLVNIIERHFEAYKRINLTTMRKLTNIASILAKTNKPIIIKNKYFTITFAPRYTETMLIRINEFRGKLIYRLTMVKPLYNDDKNFLLSNKDILSKFPPNFIHSMDAHLNMSYKEFIYDCNSMLIKENICINSFSNHDYFCLSCLGFLPYIMKDLYASLYNYNYILTLIDHDLTAFIIDEKSKDYLKPIFDNRYFLKV